MKTSRRDDRVPWEVAGDLSRSRRVPRGSWIFTYLYPPLPVALAGIVFGVVVFSVLFMLVVAGLQCVYRP